MKELSIKVKGTKIDVWGVAPAHRHFNYYLHHAEKFLFDVTILRTYSALGSSEVRLWKMVKAKLIVRRMYLCSNQTNTFKTLNAISLISN